jgi:adenylate kinase family enzyme
MLGASSPLSRVPKKIAVAGGAGAGKSTLARQLSELLDIRYAEMDSMCHGPNWTVRETWVDDVDKFTCGPRWSIEWQGEPTRPLLNARADLLVWLDYPRWFTMYRVVRRTLRRRFRRIELWAGNTEGPLRDFFTDRDHIVRFAWRYYEIMRNYVIELDRENERSDFVIVRIRSQRQLATWLNGPLASALQAERRGSAKSEM